MSEATVRVAKLDPSNIKRAMNEGYVWRQHAQALLDGDLTTGFKFEFGGDPFEIKQATHSCAESFRRHRRTFAKHGLFKDHVFVVQEVGSTVYVYNVPVADAKKHWKTVPSELVAAA